MSNPFEVMVIDNFCDSFRDGRNDYSCLQSLVGRNGVYIFLERETGEVQYIGEAHAQDLKERITQHFTPNDTGGTFRINWCDDEGQGFEQFQQYLGGCTLKTIFIPTEMHDIILPLEATLIAILTPRYTR